MNNLNAISESFVKNVTEASKYLSKDKNKISKPHSSASTLAFVYEKARNAVEYRDEHLIRQAAIERILKRRLFLNQPSERIANLLIKELTWAGYIEQQKEDSDRKEKFKNIIEKYRGAEQLVGLCACEIDEALNFNPLNQIIINYVSETIGNLIDFEEPDKMVKSIQIYIATERSFAKNSEVLIKYKLLKVLLPKRDDPLKLQTTLARIDGYLDYKYKDILKRKVSQLSPTFNLIRDLTLGQSNDIKNLTENQDNLKLKIKEILENKYEETKGNVRRASQRSIIYIFLTKMVLAILIEVPFDILLGNINLFVLAINVLFPPSLMFLLNSRVKLPTKENTDLITSRVLKYLYDDPEKITKENIEISNNHGKTYNIFYYTFLVTSIMIILGIIYLLNLLSFNFISQIIFMFFISVVSFFAYRVKEISNDYSLPESQNESFIDTLLDYLFLPIIKSGQWLSNQIAKINILSFVFDFIIEAPLKSFLEILEQWLHFVRVKKEEFLG
jgi:hypothetical protein